MIVDSLAQPVRQLTDEQVAMLRLSAAHYVENAASGGKLRRRDGLKLPAVLQMPFDIGDQLFGANGSCLTVPADAFLMRGHTDQHAR